MGTVMVGGYLEIKAPDGQLWFVSVGDDGAPVGGHPFFKHRNRGRKRGRNPNCKWCGQPRDAKVHTLTTKPLPPKQEG